MSNFYSLLKKAYSLLTVLLLPMLMLAQPPAISYLTEFSGLSSPVDIVNAGDGSNRLFVVEQGGTIRVRNGATVTQFANFGSTGANIITSGGERGLLSMAFHPGYNGITNRYFFIYYTDLGGNIAVSRCQTTAGNINTADLSTIVNFITIPHPGQSNHNGGKLNFGLDGYLYFATGDGGGGNDIPNNAQTGTVLLGKMLRLDIDNTSVTYGNYSVPADNPYLSDPGIDDRIWALGLRNPFRWSFDSFNGNMWIGDVGQGAFEEINFRAAGSTGHVNYGWRCFEGYESTPGVADCTPVDYVKPVYDYPNPASSSSAVTGGYVYRGTEFPNLRGYYLASDVYSGETFILWPNGSGGFDSSVQTSSVSFIVAFGEGEDGTLYALSQGTSTVYKVVGIGGIVLPVSLTGFSGIANSGYNELKWKTASEQNTTRFNIEFSKGGSLYARSGTVAATRSVTGSSYQFRHYIDNRDDVLYRLAIEDDNGAVTYSQTIKISGTRRNNIRIYPTVITNNLLNVELNGRKPKSITIINTNGMVVFKTDISNAFEPLKINLPPLAKGIYIVELNADGMLQREKIVVQ
ncbi:MAG: PQQ-dependent sugar dehydrogenase [Ferruginibacter sp.]|nr:PQQ-dependent sugar dehydrogenase [Ferruginibacter sp.]